MKPGELPAALLIFFATATRALVIPADLRPLSSDGFVVVVVVAATAAVTMIMVVIFGLVCLLGFLLCLGHKGWNSALSAVLLFAGSSQAYLARPRRTVLLAGSALCSIGSFGTLTPPHFESVAATICGLLSLPRGPGGPISIRPVTYALAILALILENLAPLFSRFLVGEVLVLVVGRNFTALHT